MKETTLYNIIVGFSSTLNFMNNACYQVFTPVFTERALNRGINETNIGLILTIYSFAMVAQSFFLECLENKFKTRGVYLMSVWLGSLTAALAIALNYLPKTSFVIVAVLCRLSAGL